MAAGMATINWLALTNVVPVCATPFQFTTALFPKLLPLTVIVKLPLPAVVLFGLSCEIAGMAPATGGVVLAV